MAEESVQDAAGITGPGEAESPGERAPADHAAADPALPDHAGADHAGADHALADRAAADRAPVGEAPREPAITIVRGNACEEEIAALVAALAACARACAPPETVTRPPLRPAWVERRPGMWRVRPPRGHRTPVAPGS